MSSRGVFIVFEGGEGVGKSTQVTRLVEHLQSTRPTLRIVQSREPGGTPAAEALRRVALDQDFVGLAPRAEALVFAAARGDHVYQVIRPALEQRLGSVQRRCCLLSSNGGSATGLHQLSAALAAGWSRAVVALAPRDPGGKDRGNP